jgi:hypothetical protein
MTRIDGNPVANEDGNACNQFQRKSRVFNF